MAVHAAFLGFVSSWNNCWQTSGGRKEPVQARKWSTIHNDYMHFASWGIELDHRSNCSDLILVHGYIETVRIQKFALFFINLGFHLNRFSEFHLLILFFLSSVFCSHFKKQESDDKKKSINGNSFFLQEWKKGRHLNSRHLGQWWKVLHI